MLNTQHPSSINSALNTQHPTPNTPHPPFNTLRSTYNTQHSASNAQHPTPNPAPASDLSDRTYRHNLFRRYILAQIDITTMMVPEFLRSCGLHPNEGGPLVRIFYCVAGCLGGRSFHAMALPLLVWTFDCAFTRLVMVFYCMTSGVGCLLKGALSTNTSTKRQGGNVHALALSHPPTLTLLLSHPLTLTPSYSLTLLLSHPLTLSPSYFHTLLLSHPLTLTLSYSLALPQSSAGRGSPLQPSHSPPQRARASHS